MTANPISAPRAWRDAASRTSAHAATGEKRESHKEIYWHFGKANAVRQGDLKAVRQGNSSWELYDLKADPSEMNDLAKERPKKASELAKMWESWSRDIKSRPGK